MTHQSLWQPISGRSSPRRSRIVFLLSREPTGVPEAEARALVIDLDQAAKFERPEEGVLIAETEADPEAIESRVAFSRRVGLMLPDGELDGEVLAKLREGTYRVRVFGEGDNGPREEALISTVAEKVDGRVSLESPDHEVSAYVTKGGSTYFALTAPLSMRQGWVTRRPRSRAFFHPSAIFPKLSRALVNFSGVQPGESFLDPFCGTGSLLIEASIVGAEPIGIDRARKMVRGARRNSIKYSQPWAGVVRADSRSLPLNSVSAIATDIPYGRASSRGGLAQDEILRALVRGGIDVVPLGRKLVVMHPKSLEVGPIVEDAGGFRIEQEPEIYIHRTLTRTITVMRRV